MNRLLFGLIFLLFFISCGNPNSPGSLNAEDRIEAPENVKSEANEIDYKYAFD